MRESTASASGLSLSLSFYGRNTLARSVMAAAAVGQSRENNRSKNFCNLIIVLVPLMSPVAVAVAVVVMTRKTIPLCLPPK